MRQPAAAAAAEEEGIVRKVAVGGNGKVSLLADPGRRRRRLEHRRRHGRAAAGGGDGAAERVRPGADGSLAESSTEVGHGIWLPACLSQGAVSVIGRRREMEDAVAVARAFLAPPPDAAVTTSGDVVDGRGEDDDEKEEDFFAVYDGHGGSRVAEACRERMHVVLAEEVGLRRRRHGGGGGCDARGWKEAMAATFSRVDGEVVRDAAAGANADAVESRSHTVGSTAVVAVVGRRRIVVANCGDSRAVLSRGGVAVPLSTDHKPDRPDELQRVEAGGGRVINWNGSRVLGVLSTSRSIGDYYLKPYVSAEPEVTVVERTEKDEFVVLASDGLWDVVSNEAACRVARSCLSGRAAAAFPETVSGRTAADAAALLVEIAVARGSRDNISVVVVQLRRLECAAAAASEIDGQPRAVA